MRIEPCEDRVMSDEPENFVLTYLRRMDQKLDRVLAELGDHRIRLTRLEENVAGLHADFAGLSGRIDRVTDRLDRIERRLDLVELPRA